jgi:hypothetical protein
MKNMKGVFSLEKGCVKETMIVPKQTVTGNDFIIILKHRICEKDDKRDGRFQVGIELAIRNISESTISTIVFEAQFYNIEGNILDTVKHKEIELKPKTSRAVFIQSSIMQQNVVRGYDLKIARMTTADAEKVQLRRHEIRTTATGGEEVRGILKNISNVRTDAALIATFTDAKDEKIGIRVIQVKDIESGELRKFHFIFSPLEGEKIKTYSLDIGEMIEQPDIE